MKKFFLLTMALLLVVFMVSCGGKKASTANAQNVAKTGTQKSVKVEKKAVKVTPTLTIKIGDNENKYEDLKIMKTGPHAYERNYHTYNVYAAVDKEGHVGISMEFTYNDNKVSDVSMDIKGYKVTKVNLTVNKFITRKNQIGEDVLEHLSISFNGEAKKLDNNGFPTKNVVQFSGTIVK